VYDEAVAKLTSGAPSGYTYAESYDAVTLKSGGTVTVTTGSSVVLTSGSAKVTVTKGTVINVSTGEEVSSGSALTKYQRYFAAEDTEAVYTMTAEGTVMAEGYYKSSGTSQSSRPFTDVPDYEWYYSAVYYCYDNSLFNGTSDTNFSPNGSMTRAMFVTVLYRMAGSPAVSGGTTFTDLVANEYYVNPVKWAAANGIISGYGDGKFGPDDPVTREQMAVIMYNYAKYSGKSVTATSAVMNTFPDAGKVSDWAQTAMAWATTKKIINGSDGYLQPDGTAIRAQVAQIVKNYKEIVG
jgi:hypothetical protein